MACSKTQAGLKAARGAGGTEPTRHVQRCSNEEVVLQAAPGTAQAKHHAGKGCADEGLAAGAGDFAVVQADVGTMPGRKSREVASHAAEGVAIRNLETEGIARKLRGQSTRTKSQEESKYGTDESSTALLRKKTQSNPNR